MIIDNTPTTKSYFGKTFKERMNMLFKTFEVEFEVNEVLPHQKY